MNSFDSFPLSRDFNEKAFAEIFRNHIWTKPPVIGNSSPFPLFRVKSFSKLSFQNVSGRTASSVVLEQS